MSAAGVPGLPLGLAGGGGTAINPSSGVQASTAQASSIGSTFFNFGGINLGNQDIPVSQSTSDPTNQTPTIGAVPPTGVSGLPRGFSSSGLSSVNSYLPMLLVVGGLIALAIWAHGKL